MIRQHVCVLGVLMLVGCGTDTPDEEPREVSMCLEDPGEIFERRIAPLLAEDRPSSCNQCHLSGINLGLFVRETECETMACLKADGLVDFESPEASLILSWIERATPQSEAITEEVLREEYEGVRSWIEYHADCATDDCQHAVCDDPQEQTACANGHDREGEAPEINMSDCSERAVADAFLENVFAWRGRCVPCHEENNTRVPFDYPRWVSDSNVCGAGSAFTMSNLMERGLINLERPEASLLLLKPLDERFRGMEHGGGTKFADPSDPAYQDFLRWIQYAAACAPAAD